MRILFSEDDASPVSDTLFPKTIVSTFPHLPLVPYHDPAHFILKLAKVIKVQMVCSTYIIGTYSGCSSYKLGFFGSSQTYS